MDLVSLLLLSLESVLATISVKCFVTGVIVVLGIWEATIPSYSTTCAPIPPAKSVVPE